ncbi:MAG TPA: DUF5696 domain-containing protein [Bryobacteraceae bacterium]|nr:DUF5696 domain-containing protein [Bryobacteraceae bacterium]
MYRLPCLFLICVCAPAQGPLPREQWGATNVSVTQRDNEWIIAGRKTKVILKRSDLALRVQAGPATWSMMPSQKDDMLVRAAGEEFYVRLADAGSVHIEPFDAGFKTGVKVILQQFRRPGVANAAPLDLRLYLMVCLEGREEDLVFNVSVAEGHAVVRQLDWPKELDTADPVDHTVLSNRWGTLLPRDWPKEYSPIRAMKGDRIDPADVSVVESNLIESWSMSWWGFQKGRSAMMLIIETPDDAAYKLHHPAGGPTVMGPRWRAQLGRLGYPRTVRMVFFDRGNYVTMAKRYRRHVTDSGQFVSLREKIAREPLVKELIGTPHIRLHLLTNYRPGGFRYDSNNKDKNFRVVTFDQRIAELQKLKARGIDRLYVCLAGWPYRGYDRQHPDELPPAPEAGGWDGMKRFADAMRELKYLFVPHDQYRDYYTDAPSYQEQFAIHEEDGVRPPMVFPGTRFGQTKAGYIPFMNHWDGGLMTYLNPRYQLGHLKKNYRLMFEHGIRPHGVYLDVFGYIPPDQDFNPQHPATRRDSMDFRAACFRWVRNNLGLVGTEAAADWTVPYVDFGSANPGRGTAIPVPLYQLVYHDAIVIPSPGGAGADSLVGFLYGSVPSISTRAEVTEETIASVRRMAALHARTGLLEMTSHEFLDGSFRKERTTFADGTTVTVDFDAGSLAIHPDVR